MAIEYKVETITPERAKSMLQRIHRPTDRPDQNKIDAYAEVMRAGGWVMNGMPIILDPNGRLIDGEYRLLACEQAGTPFTTLVAYNVKADTLHTIDQHRRRSFDQVLSGRNVEDSGAFMRVLSKLIRYENGIVGIGNKPISWSVYDAVISAPANVEFKIPDKSGKSPDTEVRAYTVGEVISEALKLSKKLTMGGRRLSSVHHTARPVFLVMSMLSGRGFEGYDFLDQASLYELHVSKKKTESAIKTPVTQLVEKSINDKAANKRQKFVDVDESLGTTINYFNYHLKGEPVPSGKGVYSKNYGDAALNHKPEDPIPPLPKIRELSPPNLGLPRLTGYPGIPGADFGKGNVNFRGKTSEILIEAAKGNLGTGKSIYPNETLKPDIAEEWLDKYNEKNRKLHKTQVSNIASDIINGRWATNAQPICFAGNPFKDEEKKVRLLNGQHRLRGLIEAFKRSGDPEIFIEVPIIVGLDEGAFATYDIQERRAKESFDVDKVDPRVMLSAAGLIWRTRNEAEIRSRMASEYLKPRSQKADVALQIITQPMTWDRIFSHPGTPSITEKNAIVEELNELMTECYKMARSGKLGSVESKIAPLGIMTAFMTLIRLHTTPDDTEAKLFIGLLNDDLEARNSFKGDEGPLRKSMNGEDGSQVLTRDGFIAKMNNRSSKRHNFLSELIRTWRAHAKYHTGRGRHIHTNLAWPARRLDELNLSAYFSENQMKMLAELEKQKEMSMRIHSLAIQDELSRGKESSDEIPDTDQKTLL